jgi:SAM-dependent methyltransferase
VGAPTAIPVNRLQPASKRELYRLAMSERSDPEPFYTKLAERSISEFPFPLRGRTVLDLGAGPGHYTAALAGAGAAVVPLDLGDENMRKAAASGLPAVKGDATRLPFPDGAFDGIFCSNMLEHVPDARYALDEIERTLRPGGWAWISWTNWYSPWGGHDITPYHFFGPRLGTRLYERVNGHPPERNPVFDGLWPTYVGRVLADVRSRPSLRMLDAVPRYYPSMRWILKVPGLREVATWNCLIMVEKPRARPSSPAREHAAAVERAADLIRSGGAA